MSLAHRSNLAAALFTVLACSLSQPSVGSSQLSEEIQVDYAAENSIFAIIFHPQEIRQAVPEETVVDELIELFPARTGIDMESAEQIYIQMSGELGVTEPPYEVPVFSMMLRSTQVIEPQKIRKRLFRYIDFSEEEHKGKTIWLDSAMRESGPCLYFPDDKTALLSYTKGIRTLIDRGKDQANPEHLVHLPRGCEVAGFLDLAGNRKYVEPIVRPLFAGLDEPEAEAAHQALDKINTGYFFVDLEADVAFDARITTDTAADAESIAAQLKLAVKRFREELAAVKPQVEAHGASELAAVEGLEMFLEQLAIETDQNHVLARIEKNDEIVAAYGGILSAFAVGLRQFE